MNERIDYNEMFQKCLRNSQPPDWVVEMHDYYRRTGLIRPEDLRRLLGDPSRRVEVGPKPSVSTFLGS